MGSWVTILLSPCDAVDICTEQATSLTLVPLSRIQFCLWTISTLLINVLYLQWLLSISHCTYCCITVSLVLCLTSMDHKKIMASAKGNVTRFITGNVTRVITQLENRTWDASGLRQTSDQADQSWRHLWPSLLGHPRTFRGNWHYSVCYSIWVSICTGHHQGSYATLEICHVMAFKAALLYHQPRDLLSQ